METTRAKLINHGGSTEFTDHICRIRINQTYPYQQQVFQILKRMRKEFKFIRYRSWYYKHGIHNCNYSATKTRRH